jgi:hypothetical protein
MRKFFHKNKSSWRSKYLEFNLRYNLNEYKFITIDNYVFILNLVLVTLKSCPFIEQFWLKKYDTCNSCWDYYFHYTSIVSLNLTVNYSIHLFLYRHWMWMRIKVNSKFKNLKIHKLNSKIWCKNSSNFKQLYEE